MGWIAAGVAMCVLGGAALRANSQDDAFRLLSGAIVGPKTAYLPLPVELVSSAQVMEVSPNPEGQDALIIAMPAPAIRGLADILEPDGESNTDKRMMRLMESGGGVEMNVLLWSAGSRKASTVFRGGGSLQTGMTVPVSAEWFAGSRIALLQVMSMKGPLTKEQMEKGDIKPAQSLVRVNGATGKTQLLVSSMSEDAQLLMSPFDPTAVIVSDKGAVLQRISANGSVSVPVKVNLNLGEKPEDNSVYWFGWLPDSKMLRGSLSTINAEGKRTTKRVFLDTITGLVTDDTTPKGTRPAPVPVPEPLPFVVHQGRETLTREDVKTEVHPLWLEGRDKETVGRTLIAADSDADKKPVVLQTAVLFQNKGAVYAVPLLKSNVTEFLAQRRAAQKQEALTRAKQIGLGMLMYAQDYDENFPPVGGDLSKIINPYLKNTDVFNNPATGQGGFTPAYKITSLSGYDMPAVTPLGYLDGPGGRAIIFADGHVRWEDTPSTL